MVEGKRKIKLTKNKRRDNPGAALYGQALEQSQKGSIQRHKFKKGGKVVDELEAALYGQAQKFRNWIAKENKSISEINK